jgi:hypothetical protein
MDLVSVSVKDPSLFPHLPGRAEILQRSTQQACALPVGSSRGTKGAGARR